MLSGSALLALTLYTMLRSGRHRTLTLYTMLSAAVNLYPHTLHNAERRWSNRPHTLHNAEALSGLPPSHSTQC